MVGSVVPKTNLDILLWRIAPEHIRHGSTVTYNVQPLKSHLPRFFSASLMASISACEEISSLAYRPLCPLPTIFPSKTTMAPTETSFSSMAFLASNKAKFIYCSSVIGIFYNKNHRTGDDVLWLLRSRPDQVPHLLLAMALIL